MGKFRKKPVVIEAVQFTGEKMPLADVPQWLVDAMISRVVTTPEDEKVLAIKTLEGTMTANPSDWIIRGVKGELYPCRDDIFKITYDEANE